MIVEKHVIVATLIETGERHVCFRYRGPAACGIARAIAESELFNMSDKLKDYRAEPINAPPYELSKTQAAFVRKAEKEGFEIEYGYSGRFMYGRKCPAVYLGHDEVGAFGFRGAKKDNLGLGEVIYMPE